MFRSLCAVVLKLLFIIYPHHPNTAYSTDVLRAQNVMHIYQSSASWLHSYPLEQMWAIGKWTNALAISNFESRTSSIYPLNWWCAVKNSDVSRDRTHNVHILGIHRNVQEQAGIAYGNKLLVFISQKSIIAIWQCFKKSFKCKSWFFMFFKSPFILKDVPMLAYCTYLWERRSTCKLSKQNIFQIEVIYVLHIWCKHTIRTNSYYIESK